jgi:hypothetical protein
MKKEVREREEKKRERGKKSSTSLTETVFSPPSLPSLSFRFFKNRTMPHGERQYFAAV